MWRGEAGREDTPGQCSGHTWSFQKVAGPACCLCPSGTCWSPGGSSSQGREHTCPTSGLPWTLSAERGRAWIQRVGGEAEGIAGPCSLTPSPRFPWRLQRGCPGREKADFWGGLGWNLPCQNLGFSFVYLVKLSPKCLIFLTNQTPPSQELSLVLPNNQGLDRPLVRLFQKRSPLEATGQTSLPTEMAQMPRWHQAGIRRPQVTSLSPLASLDLWLIDFLDLRGHLLL